MLGAGELETGVTTGGGGGGRGGEARRSWRPPAAAVALVGEERGESDEEDVDIEDEKTQGLFCIYSCPLKGYGPK